MTNLEKIKAMSNEELTNFFNTTLLKGCVDCPHSVICMRKKYKMDYIKEFKAWLNSDSEVEE